MVAVLAMMRYRMLHPPQVRDCTCWNCGSVRCRTESRYLQPRTLAAVDSERV